MTLNRFTPNLPASAMRTYTLSAPVATHHRDATCEEVECEMQANGWRTRVDETTELGQRQAYYIRKQSGRRFFESRDETGLTNFDFPAGQKCFQQHRRHLEREPRYLVLGGDWRGDPRGEGVREHTNADNWIDEFQTNLDSLRTTQERG